MFYYIYRISEDLKNKLKDSQISYLNIDKINLSFNKENDNVIHMKDKELEELLTINDDLEKFTDEL